MNKIDAPLIAALRNNARASVSELAIDLGVSRATVRTRINNLQDSGKILGFTTVLAGESERMPVMGVTMIEIEGKTNDPWFVLYRVLLRLWLFTRLTGVGMWWLNSARSHSKH